MKVNKYALEDCTTCNGKSFEQVETEIKIVSDFKCAICMKCGELLASEKIIVIPEKKQPKRKINVMSRVSKDILSFQLNKIYREDTFIQTKGIESNSVDLIIEDTPYGYGYQSNARKEKFEVIENDTELSWLEPHIEECYRMLKEDRFAYFFCQDTVIDIFKNAISKHFTIKNILTWDKGGGGMGDLEGSQAKDSEFIIFAAKGKPKLKTKRAGSILKFKKDAGSTYQHPTQKPINLIRKLIQDSTDKDDIVFDGFMGRGTTAMACVMEERRFLGFEMFEEYFNIAEENIKKTRLGLNVLDSKVLKNSGKSKNIHEQLSLF